MKTPHGRNKAKGRTIEGKIVRDPGSSRWRIVLPKGASPQEGDTVRVIDEQKDEVFTVAVSSPMFKLVKAPNARWEIWQKPSPDEKASDDEYASGSVRSNMSDIDNGLEDRLMEALEDIKKAIVGSEDVEETWLSIDEVCKRGGFSRTTFYEMYNHHGLDEICDRFPPYTGNIRVPLAEFVQWLKKFRKTKSKK